MDLERCSRWTSRAALRRHVRRAGSVCLIAVVSIIGGETTARAAPAPQVAGPVSFDVTVSLYNAPATSADREPYEHIIEFFADGVFEASNGVHRIGTVRMYGSRELSDRADILWTEDCWPQAHVSGRNVANQHISMCDRFKSNDFLEDEAGWRGGGYALAHEWGHYFYSLYDEYRCSQGCDNADPWQPHATDDAVDESIMSNQWRARGGDFDWLNFSTARNAETDTVQFRVYGASGWETLARPLSEDPRDGQRQVLPWRIFYSELASVAPAGDSRPAIDLPGTARQDLEIIWMTDAISYQIVLDHSGSMDYDNKMESARIAAKLMLDVAEIGRTSVGVIEFDEAVSIVHPLTLIDSEQTREAVKAGIDSIMPAGSTAIGDAARQGLASLLASAGDGSNRIVYLLTDGQSNAGSDPLSVIPEYQSAEIPLYTFGFGNDVSSSLLQRMAQDTGGQYYFSPTSLADLSRVFQDANQRSSSTVGIADSSATVTSGSPATFPFFVDNTLTQMDIVSIHQGPPDALSLELRGPDNSTLRPEACHSSGSETLCVFSQATPAAGEWSLVAAATGGAGVPYTYRVSGRADGDLTFTASVNLIGGEVTLYPQPIEVMAILSREAPIAGAGVEAVIERPSGAMEQFELADDGIPPDAIANDGRYSALLSYEEDGPHTISVEFNNEAGGAEVSFLSYQHSLGPDGEYAPPQESIPVPDNFHRLARTQTTVVGVRQDDHADDITGATLLPGNNSDIAGRIDDAGDVDAFAIDVGVGDSLVLRVSDLGLGIDPRLQVLEADGETVLQDVGLSPADSTASYLAVALPVTDQEAVRVYARVTDQAGSEGGVYNISAGRQLVGDSLGITSGGNPAVGMFVLLGSLGMLTVFLYQRGLGSSNWTLFVEEPGHTPRRVRISRQGVLIGRDRDCQVRLNDPQVSRRHATIKPAGGDSDRLLVRDEGSQSGTFRNGKRIEQAGLSERDELRIGDTRLLAERRGRGRQVKNG